MKRKAQITGGEPERTSAVAAMTNLLALNTMLEAARIGQEGRGFATVAEELSEITRKTNQSCSRKNFLRKRPVSLDPDELDTAVHDQLHAMEDLNSSLSSITQLAAEITKSPGHKSIPKKELNHLYEILCNNSGKDIA